MTGLVGTRCPACGRTVAFAEPPCPACGAPDARVVALPPTGVIESYTRVADQWIVEVRLDRGPLVLAAADGAEAVEIGAPVSVADDAGVVHLGR